MSKKSSINPIDILTRLEIGADGRQRADPGFRCRLRKKTIKKPQERQFGVFNPQQISPRHLKAAGHHDGPGGRLIDFPQKAGAGRIGDLVSGGRLEGCRAANDLVTIAYQFGIEQRGNVAQSEFQLRLVSVPPRRASIGPGV